MGNAPHSAHHFRGIGRARARRRLAAGLRRREPCLYSWVSGRHVATRHARQSDRATSRTRQALVRRVKAQSGVASPPSTHPRSNGGSVEPGFALTASRGEVVPLALTSRVQAGSGRADALLDHVDRPERPDDQERPERDERLERDPPATSSTTITTPARTPRRSPTNSRYGPRAAPPRSAASGRPGRWPPRRTGSTARTGAPGTSSANTIASGSWSGVTSGLRPAMSTISASGIAGSVSSLGSSRWSRSVASSSTSATE